MIHVKRKQFPVGQGGLHAEIVHFPDKKMVMVYDCGSVSSALRKKNSPKPIIREIQQLEKYLEDSKTIDYLVLSHLHEDHINGVEYLKQYDWKVNHLVLPYTTLQEKIFYAAGFAANNSSSSLVEFVLNPGNYFEGGSTLIEVGPEGENPNLEEQDFPNENSLPNLDSCKRTILQGAYVISKSRCDWGVAFFNYRNQELSNWIKQNFPSNILNSFSQWDSVSKNQAIAVYKNALSNFKNKNFNLTSLCVFSGCLLDAHCGVHRRIDMCCRDHWSDKSGWIHTGDILLTDDCLQEFTTFFISYLNRTGVVQIPHHGSKNGYDKILNIQAHTVSVVCVGERNQYKHPNVNVLHEVQTNMGHLVFVTNNVGSGYEEQIHCKCNSVPKNRPQSADYFF